MAYIVTIKYQFKTPGKGRWYGFDSEEKSFPDLQTAKKFIKETFSRVKTKSRMYQDKTDGKREQSGWVFSWKEKSQEQEFYGKTFYVQAWVSLIKADYERIKW